MKNILVYHESSPVFICNIAYKYQYFSPLIAHIWEHLVLNTHVDHQHTLKNKITDMGGIFQAETSLPLTNFFMKIPYIKNYYPDVKSFLEVMINTIRHPTIEENFDKTMKEVLLEEMQRKDNPLVFTIEKLRSHVYRNYENSISACEDLRKGVQEFSEQMAETTLFIATTGDFSDPDKGKIVFDELTQNRTADDTLYNANCFPSSIPVERLASQGGDEKKTNYFLEKTSPSTSGNTNLLSYLKNKTTLEYISILFLPSHISYITLPFFNFIIFGPSSIFIRRLINDAYIYNYRNGINYFDPIGFEFVTAVLPGDRQAVLDIWRDFQNNADTYLSIGNVKKLLENFLQQLNCEWIQLDRKIKWIAESFPLFGKVIGPKEMESIVYHTDILELLPKIIKNSTSYMFVTGPNKMGPKCR